jgi:two-component system sensor histidine kinase YesM
MKVKARIPYKKQTIMILLLLIVPFLGCLLLYNLYTVNTVVNSNVFRENESKLRVISSSFEKYLINIHTFMSSTVANDTNFKVLGYKVGKLDAYLSSYEILEKSVNVMSMYDVVTGFFVYSAPNDLFWSKFQSGARTMDRPKLTDELRAMIDQRDFTPVKWFVRELNGQPYLVRVLEYNQAYFLCMIDLNEAARLLNVNSLASGEALLFADEDMQALTTDQLLHSNTIALKTIGSGRPYYSTKVGDKNYLFIQSEFGVSGLSMVYLVVLRSFWNNMDSMQLWLLLSSILCLLLVPVGYYLLKRSFFSPFKGFVNTMNSIKEGNFDVAMTNHSPILEFEQMSETFNDMLHEIKSLKIKAYEQKLEAQLATMQYLRIQIRPHFYLNCLNNLYALAQSGSYKQIQEMILLLSVYLRHMFQKSSYFVSLADEMHNTETYVELQRMTQSVSISLSADIDSELQGFPIPPITVLTFVENSLKFWSDQDKPLNIAVKARYLKNDAMNYVNITIMDNGKGFSEEELRRLNADQSEEDPQHVGIGNVKQRLFFQYEGEAVLFFSNANGACVDLFIPHTDFNNQSEFETNDEVS